MSSLSFSAGRNPVLSAETISAVLVDDSDFVRSIWHKFIERIEGLAVIGSFSDVDEAIAYISSNPPQIILLDLEINGKSGLKVLKFVVERFAQIKVFVVTTHAEDMYRTFCIDAGAYAFFEKGTQFTELVTELTDCAARKSGDSCRGVS